jgi:pyridoxine/pyridoxamine 5'-phosphate oxidase
MKALRLYHIIRWNVVFPTEEVAMRYYKTAMRPALARLMAHASRQVDATVVHRKLA